MLVWGSRSETKDLGIVDNRRCDSCEKERPFRVILQYKWSHLYWIFGQVSEKRYSMICESCQKGWDLNTDQVEAKLVTNPIPVSRRLGWVVPALAFLALLLWFISEAVTSSLHRQTGRSPEVDATQVVPNLRPATTAQVRRSIDPALLDAPPPQDRSAPDISVARPAFWLQLGTFASLDNAEQLGSTLRAAGYSVAITPVQVGDRTLHRVRAGPTQDRAAAVELQERLASIGHKSSIASYSADSKAQ